MHTLAAIVIGFIMDCLLGDPANIPHPVILIGKWISKGEKLCRKIFPDTPKALRIAGFVMALGVIGLTAAVSFAILHIAGIISPWLSFSVQCVMCWQILAAKCLKDEAYKVMNTLKCENLAEARNQIAMLVGRDTQQLTETQIAKAAIETVAENTSDGVVAPLFYLMLGGPVLAFCYKAINTMDSMVGYKNDRYMDFGRYPAKLDDIANFIPARICGLAMVAVSGILGFDGKNAFKIFKRDRLKHASPNSAQTEAACAGALKIQLAGNASYFGKVYQKPFIGDDICPVKYSHIADSCRLMYGASILCLVVFGVVRLLFV